MLAWEYGDWFDKPLSIFSGLIIGVTAVVTLLRMWAVPPRQTMQRPARSQAQQTSAAPVNASQLHAAAMFFAARNREIARGAAALGATRGWPFQH